VLGYLYDLVMGYEWLMPHSIIFLIYLIITFISGGSKVTRENEQPAITYKRYYIKLYQVHFAKGENQIYNFTDGEH